MRVDQTPPAEPAAAAAPAPPARPVTAYAPAITPGVPYAPALQTPGKPSPAPPRRPGAPKSVVTVIHRVSGWKLLALMASRGGHGVLLDELPAPGDVHTNIVAGVVSEDGRTVVARLPHAEVEVESKAFSSFPPGLFAPALPQAGEALGFTLIRSDGKAVGAEFVGLDAATGLSLLEAKEPLLVTTPSVWTTAPKSRPPVPAVGELVRLYAPAPTAAPAAPAAPLAPPDTVGDTGVIYLSIGETEGHVTQVKRAPSGQQVAATVRANRITPASTGAVATTARGDIVGIVGDTGDTESQIVPVESMRLARQRVLARRASVPQPWLGVSGDAITKFAVEQFVAMGGQREFAMPLLKHQQGVLLTSVEPGAPGSLAGLKPGDIIARAGGREFRGVGEFSQLLREAGAGARLELEVLRAFELEPLKLSVELSGIYDRQRLLTRQQGLLSPLGRLGLETIGLTQKSAANFGAGAGQLVVNVREGSPAAEAGLRPGDVIESVNGQPLTPQTWRYVTGFQPSEFTVGLVRGRERLTLKVAQRPGGNQQ